MTLASGRVNYKLFFKSDFGTTKFIAYYEPEYKRIL